MFLYFYQGGCLWLMEHATSAGLVFSRMSKNEAVWWLLRAPLLELTLNLPNGERRNHPLFSQFDIIANSSVIKHGWEIPDKNQPYFSHFSGETPRSHSFATSFSSQSCRIKVVAFLNNLTDISHIIP